MWGSQNESKSLDGCNEEGRHKPNFKDDKIIVLITKAALIYATSGHSILRLKRIPGEGGEAEEEMHSRGGGVLLQSWFWN